MKKRPRHRRWRKNKQEKNLVFARYTVTNINSRTRPINDLQRTSCVKFVQAKHESVNNVNLTFIRVHAAMRITSIEPVNTLENACPTQTTMCSAPAPFVGLAAVTQSLKEVKKTKNKKTSNQSVERKLWW